MSEEKKGCMKKDKLKKTPEECSPEQIRECHGDEGNHPCIEEKKGCMKKDKLKQTPEKCSPEQIRECHGDDGNHPCS